VEDEAVNFFRDESGQTLIEYALLCALIALGAIAGMQTIAQEVNNAFTKIGSRLASLVGGTDSDGH
jgi:pilus assembly protein Flp/PilA